jgi:hypothetical protein
VQKIRQATSKRTQTVLTVEAKGEETQQQQQTKRCTLLVGFIWEENNTLQLP